jgi:hypothetical protein
MTFWKRQNCSDGEKDQWLPEVGGRQGWIAEHRGTSEQ